MKPSCRPSSTDFTAATAIRSSAMRWPAGAPASAIPLLTKWRSSRLSATTPAYGQALTFLERAAKLRYERKNRRLHPAPTSLCEPFGKLDEHPPVGGRLDFPECNDEAQTLD